MKVGIAVCTVNQMASKAMCIIMLHIESIERETKSSLSCFLVQYTLPNKTCLPKQHWFLHWNKNILTFLYSICSLRVSVTFKHCFIFYSYNPNRSKLPMLIIARCRQGLERICNLETAVAKEILVKIWTIVACPKFKLRYVIMRHLFWSLRYTQVMKRGSLQIWITNASGILHWVINLHSWRYSGWAIFSPGVKLSWCATFYRVSNIQSSILGPTDYQRYQL